jgi:SET domain-containing protein
MAFLQSDAIEVKQIRGKGRGVFARRAIRQGETIERVPVLVLPATELGEAHGANHKNGSSNGNGNGKPRAGTGLWEFTFEWGKGTVALALGYGSLYNHSYNPNARCDDYGARTKVFTALRDIAPGEEITINYNGEPDDRSPVWFDPVGE